MTESIDIELDGVEFCVEFYYQQAERATWDCPGCSEEVEICKVSLQESETDLLLFMKDEVVKELEVRCLKRLNENERQNLEDLAESRYYDRMAA